MKQYKDKFSLQIQLLSVSHAIKVMEAKETKDADFIAAIEDLKGTKARLTFELGKCDLFSSLTNQFGNNLKNNN